MKPKAKARRRVLRGRALLVATAGAATVVYLGCGSSSTISGNLVAPPGDAAAADGKASDATDDFGISSGNLVAPPPPPPPSDAGDAASDAPGDAPEGG